MECKLGVHDRGDHPESKFQKYNLTCSCSKNVRNNHDRSLASCKFRQQPSTISHNHLSPTGNCCCSANNEARADNSQSTGFKSLNDVQGSENPALDYKMKINNLKTRFKKRPTSGGRPSSIVQNKHPIEAEHSLGDILETSQFDCHHKRQPLQFGQTANKVRDIGDNHRHLSRVIPSESIRGSGLSIEEPHSQLGGHGHDHHQQQTQRNLNVTREKSVDCFEDDSDGYDDDAYRETNKQYLCSINNCKHRNNLRHQPYHHHDSRQQQHNRDLMLKCSLDGNTGEAMDKEQQTKVRALRQEIMHDLGDTDHAAAAAQRQQQQRHQYVTPKLDSLKTIKNVNLLNQNQNPNLGNFKTSQHELLQRKSDQFRRLQDLNRVELCGLAKEFDHTLGPDNKWCSSADRQEEILVRQKSCNCDINQVTIRDQERKGSILDEVDSNGNTLTGQSSSFIVARNNNNDDYTINDDLIKHQHLNRRLQCSKCNYCSEKASTSLETGSRISDLDLVRLLNCRHMKEEEEEKRKAAIRPAHELNKLNNYPSDAGARDKVSSFVERNNCYHKPQLKASSTTTSDRIVVEQLGREKEEKLTADQGDDILTARPTGANGQPLQKRPIKLLSSRNSLPASLRRIGKTLFAGQDQEEAAPSCDQLIAQFQILDNEKRSLYRPMSWNYIAKIYKQRQTTSVPRTNKMNSSNDDNNNNNNKKRDGNSRIEISNPMYVDKSSDGGDCDTRGQEARYKRETGSQIQSQYNGSQTLCSKMKHSCFCQLLLNMLHNLFPIIKAFRDYSFPGDLLSDLFTGLTIAIMQVPQGMAYGMLAGVDPIYGLYVSLIPVLVMAFMSKSRHVSYGTFAIISILLASSTDTIKTKLKLSQVSRSLVVSERPEFINQNKLSQASRIGSASSALMVNLNDDQSIGVPKQIIDHLLSTEDATVSNTDPQSTLISGQQALFNPTNIEILTTICITVGVLQILMALLRLGHLAVIFSDQLVSSFTCASAVHVLTSQLAGLFDLDTPNVPEGLFKVCRTWWLVFNTMLNYTNNNNTNNAQPMNDFSGTTTGSPPEASTRSSFINFNIYTASLSLISISFLLTVKEFVEPWLRLRAKAIKCLPSELILMTCIVFSSWYWQFNANYEIKIVGHVPTGLPAPKLPPVELVPYALQDALTIALISYAMNLSLAQVYAKRYRYKMDSNQELFALGSANLVGSFFNCFPCASSLSRSAIQSNLNARSPLAPIFSCSIVLSIICYLAPILYDLPKSTLSCIIVIALKGVIMQCRDLSETWRLSKLDACTWLVTFWGVIAFGVTYGLVIGIVSSLLTIFFRILTPNYSILGQLPGTDIFVDKSAFGDCEEIDQVKIFRFNSPLCYMNRTMFRARVESALPSIFKRFDYMKLFCPNRRRGRTTDAESERQHHQQQITICNSQQYEINYQVNSERRAKRVRYFIIDCSALAYCDHAGANLLIELIDELQEHKVTVYLAACPIKLVMMIERMGFGSILETNVYPTIRAAVEQAKYLRDTTKTNTTNNKDNPLTLSTIYCNK